MHHHSSSVRRCKSSCQSFERQQSVGAFQQQLEAERIERRQQLAERSAEQRTRSERARDELLERRRSNSARAKQRRERAEYVRELLGHEKSELQMEKDRLRQQRQKEFEEWQAHSEAMLKAAHREQTARREATVRASDVQLRQRIDYYTQRIHRKCDQCERFKGKITQRDEVLRRIERVKRRIKSGDLSLEVAAKQLEALSDHLTDSPSLSEFSLCETASTSYEGACSSTSSPPSTPRSRSTATPMFAWTLHGVQTPSNLLPGYEMLAGVPVSPDVIQLYRRIKAQQFTEVTCLQGQITIDLPVRFKKNVSVIAEPVMELKRLEEADKQLADIASLATATSWELLVERCIFEPARSEWGRTLAQGQAGAVAARLVALGVPPKQLHSSGVLLLSGKAAAPSSARGSSKRDSSIDPERDTLSIRFSVPVRSVTRTLWTPEDAWEPLWAAAPSRYKPHGAGWSPRGRRRWEADEP